VRRIIVLHPSHHVYLDGCAISNASTIETPLGPLKTCEETREALLSGPGNFTLTNRQVDEDEHSGEMQYPFIRHCIDLASKIGTSSINDIKVLPIMIGSISPSREREYAGYLSSLLLSADTFFVISSDFCHWGRRFEYNPYDKSKGEICDYIEWLDRLGMEKISMQDPGAFAEYLRTYKNTICGRHPIGVLLNCLDVVKREEGRVFGVTFEKYEQSERVKRGNGSSVSYASGVVDGV